MRILFIDDNPDILACMAPFFSRAGHEVITALGGENGISAMKRGGYDLIVSDREMPVVNGLQLAQLRKDLKINVPFVLYTGNTCITDRELEQLEIQAVYDKMEIEKLLEDISEYKAS